LDKYGGIFNTELEKKQFLFTGTVDGGWDSDSRINAVFNIIFFYCVWQCKLSRRAPCFVTIEDKMLTIFDGSLTCNKKSWEKAEISDTFVCREWRRRQGQG
jgi:hypothetical protein